MATEITVCTHPGMVSRHAVSHDLVTTGTMSSGPVKREALFEKNGGGGENRLASHSQ